MSTALGRTKIAGGTTFNTAHMTASNTSLGFAPGQTLNSTILFEGAGTSGRFVEMNGTAGSFTIGATGVIRTETGFAGSAQIGATFQFGGAMTLLNQGLISSRTNGRTVTLNPASLATRVLSRRLTAGRSS